MGITLWHPELSNIGECDIGNKTIIHSHVWVGNGVKIGKNCKIQAFSFIPTGVTIGDDVFIGPHVCFTNDKNPPSGKWSETFVEDGVSIGAGAVILSGLTIHKNARIGAGSVVTKDVKAGAIVVGNPAKRI